MPLCYETAATATKTSLLSDVLKKVNSRCFKLCHSYSISFNSSNVGKCGFGVEF